MSRQNWQGADGHTTLAALMLWLEGELGKDATAVSRHHQECWICRERAESLHQGVCTFIAHYREMVEDLPAAEPPPGFLRRLRAESAGAASPLEMARRRMAAMFRAVPRQAWLATTASMVLCFTLPYVAVIAPSRLTASEFLERACAGAADASFGTGSRLHRRVRIRRGAAVWEHPLPAPGTKSAAAPPDPEALAALKLAHVNWDDPLNARNFAQWHREAVDPRDRVSETTDSITLETTVVTGPVRFASFVVDRRDWRPVRHHLKFADQPEIDVSELPPLLVSEEPAVARSAARPSSIERGEHRAADGPSEADLDESEVRLREVLHALRADLYAAPLVRREPRQIALLVFPPSPARRNEIFEAVRDIPYVAPATATSEPAQASDIAPSGKVAAAAPAPLRLAPLAEKLREYFGGLDAANSYLARLADARSKTLLAGSALSVLRDRYSPAEWQRLPAGLRTRLERLVEENRVQLRGNARFYDELAAPVLDAMSRQLGIEEVRDRESGAVPAAASWREESAVLATQITRMHSALTRVFAQVEQPAGEGDVAVRTVLVDCSQARLRLEHLLRYPPPSTLAPLLAR